MHSPLLIAAMLIFEGETAAVAVGGLPKLLEKESNARLLALPS
jgi:hypothetical protein